jgi:hypothetical protein
MIDGELGADFYIEDIDTGERDGPMTLRDVRETLSGSVTIVLPRDAKIDWIAPVSYDPAYSGAIRQNDRQLRRAWFALASNVRSSSVVWRRRRRFDRLVRRKVDLMARARR